VSEPRAEDHVVDPDLRNALVHKDVVDCLQHASARRAAPEQRACLCAARPDEILVMMIRDCHDLSDCTQMLILKKSDDSDGQRS